MAFANPREKAFSPGICGLRVRKIGRVSAFREHHPCRNLRAHAVK
jgi:hypothetical protein